MPVRTHSGSRARRVVGQPVRDVVQNAPAECPLASRELAVLRLVSAGLRRKQIADALGITVSCVSYRLSRASQKLGVKTTAQMVAVCSHAGWIAAAERVGGAEAAHDPATRPNGDDHGARSSDKAATRPGRSENSNQRHLKLVVENRPSDVPYGCPLTAGQFETLRLVSEGLSYKEIAVKRCCTISTVRTHVSAICSKLNVARSAQAVLLAYRKGWLDDHAENQTSLQVRRLADVTEELVTHLQSRKDKLPPGLTHYLGSFDDLMHARDEEDRLRARELMEQSLDRVLREKGIARRTARTHNSAFAKLLDALITEKRDSAALGFA